MEEAMGLAGNPSSVHAPGREARRRRETARRQLAASIAVPERAIIFTSGATEANVMALRGCGRARLLISAIEHDSVRAAVQGAGIIPVSPEGVVDLDALDSLLAAGDRPALVSLMLVNNEIGTIQPVAEAAAIAHRHGALLHCDAAQALGKLAVDFTTLGADMLTLSAHKCGGPPGAGALVLRDHLPVTPLTAGGGQEHNRRPGTENLLGIIGFGAAAEAAESLPYAGLAPLRDRLEDALLDSGRGARGFGRDALRVANTAMIALPGLPAETQLMALDLAGYAVSSGSACSSGKVTQSHVLTALGAPPEMAGCAIRISLGPSTTAVEIDGFIAAWKGMSKR
jgi:cysteine desulfurase